MYLARISASCISLTRPASIACWPCGRDATRRAALFLLPFLLLVRLLAVRAEPCLEECTVDWTVGLWAELFPLERFVRAEATDAQITTTQNKATSVLSLG